MSQHGASTAGGQRVHRTQSALQPRRPTLFSYGRSDDRYRTIRPLNREYSTEQGYVSNGISTSKYTWLTLLPKNLFEQFHRLANVYFLFIVILNWLPMVQAFAKEIAMLPLLFVLLVTLVKDAYEDSRRRRQDKETNRRTAMVYDKGTGEWNSGIEWRNIEVGDIIQLYQNEIIPADMLLLDTSHEDGICFVETANLDGETNLKQRRLFMERTEAFDPDAFSETSQIECELPNNKIYQFNGTMKIRGHKEIALDQNNILLRGCVLRNTRRAIGIVVYAGHDTKSMLNNTGPRSKRSKLERAMNYQILYCCLILVVMCVAGGIGAGVWKSDRDWKDILYIPGKDDYAPAEEGFIRIFTYFIILQVMVPISLYVSIELVKLVQVYFIQEDEKLVYVDPANQHRHKMMCRALNITEDLGQIQYIFSDKTGTLTQNKMIFHQCSINGIHYSHPHDDTATFQDARSFPLDQSLVEDLEKDGGFDDDSVLHNFMLSLAMNNTVVPNNEDGELKHEAESPDEAALVAAAFVYKYVLLNRKSGRILLKLGDDEYNMEILQTLEFDSTRKRMTVIARLPNGRIRAFIKGADSAIMDIMKQGDSDLREKTEAHLHDFARNGLQPQARLRETYLAIEKEVTLLGATGIEDKLQEGVPEAIATLREAGIKVWVLTGDKQETAIEIAHTCRLMDESQSTILLNSQLASKHHSKPRSKRNEALHEQAAKETGDIIRGKLSEIEQPSARNKPLALVVDGATLSYAMLDQNSDAFLDLSLRCAVVVACRTAPLQKAQVVKLVKESIDVMTLAIGDGANDVSMIQMAHVGVGISGQEGMQAVMASDFAFGQFRFLTRLLLVHGHWSYDRIASLILYFFYKNSSLVFVIFFYQFFDGFTGQPHIEQMYLQTYNLLWTSLPPIVTGIFDQDVTEDALEAFPMLYEQGREDLTYKGRFWPIILDSFYQAVVIFFVPYAVYVDKLEDNGMLVMGTISIFCIIIANLIQNMILTRHYIWIHALCLAWSFFGVFAFAYIYNSLLLETPLIPDPYYVMQNASSDATFWLLLIFCPALAVLPRFLAMFYRRWWHPTTSQLMREDWIKDQRRRKPLPLWLNPCLPWSVLSCRR
ncbi:uncharacterized protein MONBRDRAFT_23245 [Monosiga brevicollis MX1]|uniref:Phospholipid-transporting ATPase n=1 Tax=Monosiga brevicollis TaxID=81824 RepID=A9URL5_MONBE|nr:uncharacterized protein MONBRDRAFT_23245 [Monosiga brevicollis MX1]EDQ92264.1 predicted protein [Monosiga brevicollis MX1]|eukprot:XP_001743550.1 hypothetical protein [Monosiga brevicollis MX1]